jgi:fatty acid desaturase
MDTRRKRKRDWILPVATIAALVMLVTGMIPWPLWWLLLPLWLSASAVLILAAIYLFVHAIGK